MLVQNALHSDHVQRLGGRGGEGIMPVVVAVVYCFLRYGFNGRGGGVDVRDGR